MALRFILRYLRLLMRLYIVFTAAAFIISIDAGGISHFRHEFHIFHL